MNLPSVFPRIDPLPEKLAKNAVEEKKHEKSLAGKGWHKLALNYVLFFPCTA